MIHLTWHSPHNHSNWGNISRGGGDRWKWQCQSKCLSDSWWGTKDSVKLVKNANMKAWGSVPWEHLGHKYTQRKWFILHCPQLNLLLTPAGHKPHVNRVGGLYFILASLQPGFYGDIKKQSSYRAFFVFNFCLLLLSILCIFDLMFLIL